MVLAASWFLMSYTFEQQVKSRTSAFVVSGYVFTFRSFAQSILFVCGVPIGLWNLYTLSSTSLTVRGMSPVSTNRLWSSTMAFAQVSFLGQNMVHELHWVQSQMLSAIGFNRLCWP